MGGAIALLSSPAPPRCPLPPASPDPPASLLRPQDPGGLDGAVERGKQLGSSAGSPAEWARRSPSSPLLLLLESPSHLPLLISPASGAPILSGLHFSSPLGPPTFYRFTLGFLPSPWGSECPSSCRQAPLLWGDANAASSPTAILTALPPPTDF